MSKVSTFTVILVALLTIIILGAQAGIKSESNSNLIKIHSDFYDEYGWVCSTSPAIFHYFRDCVKLKKCKGDISEISYSDFWFSEKMRECKTCAKRMPPQGPGEGD